MLWKRATLTDAVGQFIKDRFSPSIAAQMRGNSMSPMKFAPMLLFCLPFMAASPSLAQQPAPKPAIRIDVPVAPKASKVVFNMDHVAFAGDQSIGLRQMQSMIQAYKEENTPLEIIAVFHGAAGYMMLNDEAYDRARTSGTGNPYKQQIVALQKQGVQFEECVHTAEAKGWTNSNLLPGVKVNGGAVLRLVQLMQDGFVQLQP
ncbi:DsrE family protein [Rhodoblastus sp.]|uniref:DsrE family protein n=1 Tax=Rhodoblastus sp. TaxID=1962975 RepID=UPI003F964E05